MRAVLFSGARIRFWRPLIGVFEFLSCRRQLVVAIQTLSRNSTLQEDFPGSIFDSNHSHHKQACLPWLLVKQILRFFLRKQFEMAQKLMAPNFYGPSLEDKLETWKSLPGLCVSQSFATTIECPDWKAKFVNFKSGSSAFVTQAACDPALVWPSRSKRPASQQDQAQLAGRKGSMPIFIGWLIMR